MLIVDTGVLVATADRNDADWERIRILVDRYRDLRLSGTDASVIAIAERLGVTRVATIDQRHFHVVRPAHCDALELFP